MILQEIFGISTSVFPSSIDGRVSGAYLIKHVGMNMFYIGSTRNLYKRKLTHESLLRHNRHPVKLLQEHYRVEPFVEFHCWITDNMEDAVRVEQHLVDLYWGTRFLYNKGRFVTNPAKGVASSEKQRQEVSRIHKGKIVSVETKRRMSEAHVKRHRDRKMKGVSQPNHNSRSTKVSIDGIVYPSRSAASRTLGLSHSTVEWRLKSSAKKFSTWFYLVEEV